MANTTFRLFDAVLCADLDGGTGGGSSDGGTSVPDGGVSELPATLAYPIDGSTNVDLSNAFQWNAVAAAQAYYLYVGSNPGQNDMVDSGELQTTSYWVLSLPTGQPVYATLWTEIAGTWSSTQISFSTAVVPSAVTISYPSDGQLNVDSTKAFAWTSTAGASAYELNVGTQPSGSDALNTGPTTSTSWPMGSLPAGETLYATLYLELNGRWAPVSAISFQIPAGDAGAQAPAYLATFVYPTNTSTNVDFAIPFQWNAVVNADAYYLDVGSGPSQNDVLDTGEIQATSYRVASLPTGATLYATLWTKIAGIWYGTTITFSTAPVTPFATLSYPTDGADNVDLGLPFQWNVVPNADAYYLYVGSAAGLKDFVDSGELHTTTYWVTSLPAGQPVYATLWTKVAGAWYSTQLSFAAQAVSTTSSIFLYPESGQLNVDPSQPFQWTGVSGSTAYYLYVGSQPGLNDVVNSGGTVQSTSYSIPALPLGQPLYATLYAQINGNWVQAATSTFQAVSTNSLPAVLTYPSSGATNVDLSQPFQWSASHGAETYYLYIGSAPGLKDVVDTGEILTTRRWIASLPSGQTLYATVWTKSNGVWSSTKSTFTASAATPAFSGQLRQAILLTASVREMADDNNVPVAGTPLQQVVASRGAQTALCSDFATTLLNLMGTMGLGSIVERTALNFSDSDAHTIVELFNADQNAWMILDPTFGVVARRIADGGWASSADVSAAVHNQAWSSITFDHLSPKSATALHNYYIDYPLLYNNIYKNGSSKLTAVNSISPFVSTIDLPAFGNYEFYVLGDMSGGSVPAVIDGSLVQVPLGALSNVSSTFLASSVTSCAAMTSPATLYSLKRFVF